MVLRWNDSTNCLGIYFLWCNLGFGYTIECCVSWISISTFVVAMNLAILTLKQKKRKLSQSNV
jgi:hypothetical protein